MGEFNTVGLEAVIEAFGNREQATVEAVPKMLKAGAAVLIEAQQTEAKAMGIEETAGFIQSIKGSGTDYCRTGRGAGAGVAGADTKCDRCSAYNRGNSGKQCAYAD